MPTAALGSPRTPETAPADWREQVTRWDRLHVMRAVIVAAFVLLSVAEAA